MSDTPEALFVDPAPEDFPIRLYAFDPDGAMVWQRIVEQPYVAVHIPGIDETKIPVQYVIVVTESGTGRLHNDPTCGGLFDYEPKQEEVEDE